VNEIVNERVADRESRRGRSRSTRVRETEQTATPATTTRVSDTYKQRKSTRGANQANTRSRSRSRSRKQTALSNANVVASTLFDDPEEVEVHNALADSLVGDFVSKPQSSQESDSAVTAPTSSNMLDVVVNNWRNSQLVPSEKKVSIV